MSIKELSTITTSCLEPCWAPRTTEQLKAIGRRVERVFLEAKKQENRCTIGPRPPIVIKTVSQDPLDVSWMLVCDVKICKICVIEFDLICFGMIRNQRTKQVLAFDEMQIHNLAYHGIDSNSSLGTTFSKRASIVLGFEERM